MKNVEDDSNGRGEGESSEHDLIPPSPKWSFLEALPIGSGDATNATLRAA